MFRRTASLPQPQVASGQAACVRRRLSGSPAACPHMARHPLRSTETSNHRVAWSTLWHLLLAVAGRVRGYCVLQGLFFADNVWYPVRSAVSKYCGTCHMQSDTSIFERNIPLIVSASDLVSIFSSIGEGSIAFAMTTLFISGGTGNFYQWCFSV